MSFAIKPVSDRVIIKQADNERETEGGIVIPDVVDRPDMGEVIAVGPGEVIGVEDGKEIRAEMFIKPGDRVLFVKTMVQDVRIDGVDYKVARQRDCQAIL